MRERECERKKDIEREKDREGKEEKDRKKERESERENTGRCLESSCRSAELRNGGDRWRSFISELCALRYISFLFYLLRQFVEDILVCRHFTDLELCEADIVFVGEEQAGGQDEEN